jgi:hypothetical protein
MENESIAVLRGRLVRGAEILGSLWRSGVRCEKKFALTCSCPAPTKFCRAKKLFSDLWKTAVDNGWRRPDWQEIRGDDPHCILFMMNAVEFEATGLNFCVEHPMLGKVKVGPKGISIRGLKDLSELSETTMKRIKEIFDRFPGAVLSGVK